MTPTGHTAQVSYTAPATVIGNLTAGVRDFPGRPLVKDSRGGLTYQGFAERVAGVVADLTDAGVRRGDRVALGAENRLESALLIWACARAGFVFLGLPTNLNAVAWAALLANAGPTLVLCEAGFVGRIPGAQPIETVLTGRRLPWDAEKSQPDPDDVYALVYTSGTTGTPKGVKITHRASMRVAETYRDILGLTPGDVTPIHLPFSYVSGHISQLNPIMLAGGSAVIMERFRARTLVHTIRTETATVLDVVPWMFTMLLREPDFTPAQLPALRAAMFGGAPMPDEVLASVRGRFPSLALFDVYGMSETGGMITIRDAVGNPDSHAGLPAPGAEVRVDGNGELLVRGPITTPGYWANPAATHRLLHDGWLHTGDRAVLDVAGTVTIRGRIDEMINRAGVKIAPEDVEHALLHHPAVIDAAAYGVPDGAAGAAVAAVVVIAPGSQVTVEEVRGAARALLPPHSRPRFIRAVEEVPRNPTGKIDRNTLRKHHAGAETSPARKADASRDRQ